MFVLFSDIFILKLTKNLNDAFGTHVKYVKFNINFSIIYANISIQFVFKFSTSIFY